MSQELYEPQTQSQFGQQGQQMGGMAQQSQFGGGQSFSQALPPQAIQAVTSLERIETISEFVKSRAVQQGIPEVPRIADDLKNVSELQKDLIVRQSEHVQTIGQCTQQVFQQSLQQLQQYQQQLPELQELVMEVQQSQQTIQQAVQQVPSGGQGGTGGQQMGQGGGQQSQGDYQQQASQQWQ